MELLSRSGRFPVGGLAVLLAVLACGGSPPAATSDSAEAAVVGEVGDTDRAPDLGSGFVVWESNRSGPWRIWIRRLDGSAPRQLTPDEPGRTHCCPHIAPDGSRVAYLSATGGRREYPEGGLEGSLRLIAPDGGGDREVAPRARSYFENRAVVWRGPDELIHIDGDRSTVLLDVETGRGRRLAGPPAEHGWLIDATLGHATTGLPTFSPYDPDAGTVAVRRRLGGCQPYFSSDGRWAFWTAGAGGPINRIDLAGRQVSRLIEKYDPRAPDGFGYAYFPMLSADRMLFAWAASQGGHDHFRTDYEVLVAESDPRTLELVGPVRRVTRHPATDRFPDVWQPPLALGRHLGEAPFEVRFGPLEGGSWKWSFGDGRDASGGSATYRWAEPGRYEVNARLGNQVRRGLVVVRPPRPPRALAARATADGLGVVVRFDEEIDAGAAEAAFDSSRAVAGWQAGDDPRSLVLRLTEPLRAVDRLTVTGVRDRAQRPNTMPPASLEVRPPGWPGRREGLVFLWQTADAANLVWDPELGAERADTLTPVGEARLDARFAMVLDRGAFAQGAEGAGRVVEAPRRTNQLALEATITPAGGDGVVMASAGGRLWNYRLRQSGGMLFFGLRVGPRGPEGYVETELFELPAGRPSHVVVAYDPGHLTAYLNGEKRRETDAIQGDFYQWRPRALVFGGSHRGGPGWAGRLEGVALWDRVPTAAEVRESYQLYRAVLEARDPIPRSVVVGRLVRRSRPPTLEEISPYREALMTVEYAVERQLEGPPIGGAQGEAGAPGSGLRAVQWTILDGSVLAINRIPEGSLLRLTLEPFAEQPQLEGVYMADTLEQPAGAPFYVVEAEPAG